MRGQRQHVAGRALQHRHVRRRLRHLGHQRDGRRAAADHHHALAGVVQVGRPELRMHDAAVEIGRAGELGRVALRVAVVAAAGEQEVAADARAAGHTRGVGRVRYLQRPARVGRRPVGTQHLVAEADLAVEAVLHRGVDDVAADRRAVGQRLRVRPRLEGVAQREHVGVGAHAGIAEQIPGAADRGAALQDREAAPREVVLQVHGRADAGEPGADDDRVEMLDGRGLGRLHELTRARDRSPCLGHLDQQLPRVRDDRPDGGLHVHAGGAGLGGETQAVVAQRLFGADVEQQRRQAAWVAEDRRDQRVHRIAVGAHVGGAQMRQRRAMEHRIAIGVAFDRRARAAQVGGGREQRRGVGQAFAAVAQGQHQREREIAACAFARDDQALAWRVRVVKGAQRAPRRQHVVQRRREGVLGRETIVRREDAKALQRERRGDRAVCLRRAAHEAAAVDVHQRRPRAGRAVHGVFALYPLAWHAGQRGRCVAHATGRRQRLAHHLANAQEVAHVAECGAHALAHDVTGHAGLPACHHLSSLRIACA